MVDEQSSLNVFKSLGITEVRTNDDGVLIIDIPPDKAEEFVQLYLKVMKPGRWNEYVGPQTGFYFKMASGEQRHIELTDKTQPKINKTIKEFIPNWDENENLWQWLASIDIYTDWLKA